MQTQLAEYTNQDLEQLLRNDRKRGFDLIFEQYWKRLYTYAYQIYTEEAICEDIVQEVFVSLWQKSENTSIVNLEGYLFRAVKYKVINQLRDLKFKPEHHELLSEISTPEKASRQLEYNDFELIIQTEISKLPPKCKKVFMLSRFEDFSNAEIAQELHISIRTVEKHISDALRHLKTTLPTSELSFLVILMFR